MLPIINKTTRGIAISLLLCVSQNAHGQIFDFISDYVAEQVSNYVESKVTGYFRSAVSSFWEDFVDSSARSSLSEKSAKLADFNTTSPQLSTYPMYKDIIMVNGKIDTNKTFAPMKQKTMGSFHEYLASASNISFMSMGGGHIKTQTESYLSDKQNSAVIENLESVLDNDALKYLEAIDDCGLRVILLEDINKSPGLIPAFNSSPSTLRIYKKLLGSEIRTNPRELLYWAEQADSYRDDMPKKSKLIKADDINFQIAGNNINVLYNGEQLASYNSDNRTYIVNSPEFLNFCPRPNHKYLYEGNSFETEALGRISKVSFKANKSLNKTKQKNPVKFKDIAKSINGTDKGNIFSEFLSKYNVVPAAAYAVEIYDMKNFKSNLKQFNKDLKKEQKTGFVFDLILDIKYSDYSNLASHIHVKSAQSQLVVKNHELLSRYSNALDYSGLSRK